MFVTINVAISMALESHDWHTGKSENRSELIPEQLGAVWRQEERMRARLSDNNKTRQDKTKRERFCSYTYFTCEQIMKNKNHRSLLHAFCSHLTLILFTITCDPIRTNYVILYLRGNRYNMIVPDFELSSSEMF